MSGNNFGGHKPSENFSGGQPSVAALPEKEKLSKFLVVNIYILIVMGLGSGLLLLFGEFEGKFVRVFSTLFLFIVFTAFVARDTNSNKPYWGVPISLAGNIYLLASSLLLIWGTLGNVAYGSYSILPKLLVLIITIKLATYIVQKASYLAFADQPQLSLAGKLTAGALALTALLYTLPVALDNIFNFGDIYWKLAVFSIIVSGLGVSIASLLFWNFRERVNPQIAVEFAMISAPSVPHNVQNHVNHKVAPQYGQRSGKVSIPSSEVRPIPYNEMLPAVKKDAPMPAQLKEEKVITPASQPVASEPKPAVVENPLMSHTPKEFFETPIAPAAQPAPVAAEPAKLPWPVFPDGSPIPAKPDGSPDFAALEAVNTYLRQQYGKQ